MIRPKLVVVNTDRDDQSRAIRDGKGFHFQCSGKRLIVYVLSLVLSLCFMFTLGVFVGRGVSVVRPGDLSLKGRFFRFLGLERQVGAPVPEASASWENPKKMIDSLHYYQDLTNKNLSPFSRRLPQPVEHLPAASRAHIAKAPRAAAAPKQPAGRLSAPPPVKPFPAALTPGRYTLLVASMRAREARVLVDKLKAEGYSPLVESIEFGSAKWSRILLGSFPTRKAAITFAEAFNRKEKTHALVISGANR